MRWTASVHAKLLVVLAVAIVGSIPYGSVAASSLAAGGAIQVVNLRGLERSVRLMTGAAAGGQLGAAHAIAVLRLMVVVGMVSVVLAWTEVDPLAFTIGLGTILPAVTWHGIQQAGRDS